MLRVDPIPSAPPLFVESAWITRMTPQQKKEFSNHLVNTLSHEINRMLQRALRALRKMREDGH